MTCTVYNTCHLCISLDVICSEKVLKSLQNIMKNNHLKKLTISLREVSPHYMASIVCGCFQSTTVESLHFIADRVKVRTHYKLLSNSLISSLLYCYIGYC